MTALFDTNVILDFLWKREPFKETADRLFRYCAQKELRGCVAAQSIADMFYILRKDYSARDRKELLRGVCGLLGIVGVGKNELLAALNSEDSDDLEDCLQAACAKVAGVDYIITRNPDDFVHSPVPVMPPEDFLRMLEQTGRVD